MVYTKPCNPSSPLKWRNPKHPFANTPPGMTYANSPAHQYQLQVMTHAQPRIKCLRYFDSFQGALNAYAELRCTSCHPQELSNKSLHQQKEPKHLHLQYQSNSVLSENPPPPPPPLELNSRSGRRHGKFAFSLSKLSHSLFEFPLPLPPPTLVPPLP